MVKLVVGKGGLPPHLFCQSMLTFVSKYRFVPCARCGSENQVRISEDH